MDGVASFETLKWSAAPVKALHSLNFMELIHKERTQLSVTTDAPRDALLSIGKGNAVLDYQTAAAPKNSCRWPHPGQCDYREKRV